MREFKSRNDRNIERIESFLLSNKEFEELILYGREITFLEKRFSEIRIQKEEPYKKDSALFRCKVFKK